LISIWASGRTWSPKEKVLIQIFISDVFLQRISEVTLKDLLYCAFPLEIIHCEKRLLVGLRKILKNYEKIYLIVEDVCESR